MCERSEQNIEKRDEKLPIKGEKERKEEKKEEKGGKKKKKGEKEEKMRFFFVECAALNQRFFSAGDAERPAAWRSRRSRRGAQIHRETRNFEPR